MEGEFQSGGRVTHATVEILFYLFWFKKKMKIHVRHALARRCRERMDFFLEPPIWTELGLFSRPKWETIPSHICWLPCWPFDSFPAQFFLFVWPVLLPKKQRHFGLLPKNEISDAIEHTVEIKEDMSNKFSYQMGIERQSKCNNKSEPRVERND